MHNISELQKAFEQYLLSNLDIPEEPKNLFQPCKDIVINGGKRIRPLLCLLAHQLFGTVNTDTYETGLAIELFHNFTLIHDDLMDNAPLRRGQVTVHEQYGMPGAVLSGDALNIIAYQHLNKIKDSYKTEIFSIFNKAAIEVCIGQQLDMEFEQRKDVSLDEYIQMIHLKTSVLLGMSMHAGAILGGASEEEKNHIYQFGKNLGIAFQLQDDYLDSFGDQETIGKLPGGDIRSNKKTFLNISCKQAMNEEQKSRLEALLTKEDTEKVSGIIELYKELGLDLQLKETVELYTQKAFSDLDSLKKSDESLQSLRSLAISLLKREK